MVSPAQNGKKENVVLIDLMCQQQQPKGKKIKYMCPSVLKQYLQVTVGHNIGERKVTEGVILS